MTLEVGVSPLPDVSGVQGRTQLQAHDRGDCNTGVTSLEQTRDVTGTDETPLDHGISLKTHKSRLCSELSSVTSGANYDYVAPLTIDTSATAITNGWH